MPHGVRIVDFEGAIFGHLGFDVSFLHFPFPMYSAHWATLPAGVVAEADRRLPPRTGRRQAR